MSAVSVVGQQAEITVECVQGLKAWAVDAPVTLKAGSQVTFEFTYTNGYDARQLFDNLYKLSSPDGATWSNIDFDVVDPRPPGFPWEQFEPFIWPGDDPYPCDGTSPDYFWAGYITIFGQGWVSGATYGYTGPFPWSYASFYLTFYLDHDQAGKHIVLDSATATGTNWVWEQLEANPGPAISIHPAWGGPYEYYIAESCCVGERGDVDCSGGEPDISDITRLIDFLYLSHSPLCCPEEADANGSGGLPDISDITRLIDFLYLSHTPIMLCSDTLTPGIGNVLYSGCSGWPDKNSQVMEECIEYTYLPGLRIKHRNAVFNCCIENIFASAYLSNDTIYIQERDSLYEGGCDCVCLYDIVYYVFNITPGSYTISINQPYGWGEKMVFDVDLIAEPTGTYCIEREEYPWGN